MDSSTNEVQQGYFSNASPTKMALKSSERSMQGIAGITPLPDPSLPKLSG
jgi:hypothetical protein